MINKLCIKQCCLKKYRKQNPKVVRTKNGVMCSVRWWKIEIF